MKKIILIFLTLTACTGKTQQILAPTDYTGWKKLTEEELNYFVPGHEAHYRIPYINPTGEKVRITTNGSGKKSYVYPEGTIVAKEIYDGLKPPDGADPIAYTVMIKDSQHPDQQGGWIWIMKDAATSEETIFKDDMCIKCHDGANEKHPYGDQNPDNEFRDYIFYPYIP